MYANVLTGVKQGVGTKHVTPRFPNSLGEVTRLLGFTPSILRAYGCQEAASPLVDIAGVTNLPAAAGSPQYRKPVMGIQEFGVRCPSSSINNFSVADSAVKPELTSFLAMYYGSFDGDGSSPNVGFGFLDNADGGQYILLNPADATENQWQGRARDDAANLKSVGYGAPTDRVARGLGMFYDASTSLLSYCVSGFPQSNVAMGAWTGQGAGTTTPTIFLGGWPGVVGSDLTSRFGLLAHGAALDGKGATLQAIMRRFGWL